MQQLVIIHYQFCYNLFPLLYDNSVEFGIQEHIHTNLCLKECLHNHVPIVISSILRLLIVVP